MVGDGGGGGGAFSLSEEEKEEVEREILLQLSKCKYIFNALRYYFPEGNVE